MLGKYIAVNIRESPLSEAHPGESRTQLLQEGLSLQFSVSRGLAPHGAWVCSQPFSCHIESKSKCWVWKPEPCSPSFVLDLSMRANWFNLLHFPRKAVKQSFSEKSELFARESKDCEQSDPIVLKLFSKYTCGFGLPRWCSGKESACSAGDPGDTGLIPELGRSPGGGNGNPLQYPCLGNPMDRGVQQATAHEVAKSRTRRSDWGRVHGYVWVHPLAWCQMNDPSHWD